MRINTNVTSLNVLNSLQNSSGMFGKSVGRLSSGFRINSAADDAAGLGIANKLRSNVRALGQASRNAEQATSVLQIAEGGVQTVSTILDRMKELATQAGSANTDDEGRTRILAEFNELQAEITGITDTTKFQGKKLLDGTFGNTVTASGILGSVGQASGVDALDAAGAKADTYTMTYAFANNTGTFTLTSTSGNNNASATVSADGAQEVTFDNGVSITLDQSFDASAFAVNANADDFTVTGGSASFLARSSGEYTGEDIITLDSLDLSLATLALDSVALDASTGTAGSFAGGTVSAADWREALDDIDSAIDTINESFGSIGAALNRIDFARQNTNVAITNFSAAESVIRDVDVAAEVTQLTKYQILQQAGQAMLGQANSAPQGVLRLLG